MKELDRWVYQAREVAQPWALHISARKEYRKIRADAEIYADYFTDYFNNKTHRMLIRDVSIAQAKTFLAVVGWVLGMYGHPLTETDKQQITDTITDIKQSFLD